MAVKNILVLGGDGSHIETVWRPFFSRRNFSVSYALSQEEAKRILGQEQSWDLIVVHSCVAEPPGVFRSDTFNADTLIGKIRIQHPETPLLGISGKEQLMERLRSAMGDACIDCVRGIDLPDHIATYFAGKSCDATGIQASLAVLPA